MSSVHYDMNAFSLQPTQRSQSPRAQNGVQTGHPQCLRAAQLEEAPAS